jgi:hypothetical protein
MTDDCSLRRLGEGILVGYEHFLQNGPPIQALNHNHNNYRNKFRSIQCTILLVCLLLKVLFVCACYLGSLLLSLLPLNSWQIHFRLPIDFHEMHTYHKMESYGSLYDLYNRYRNFMSQSETTILSI